MDDVAGGAAMVRGVLLSWAAREATAAALPHSPERPIDGSDQVVWHMLSMTSPVFELPRGYNFRQDRGIPDAERCDGFIIHTSSARLPAGGAATSARAEIRSRGIYERKCTLR